MQVDVIKWGRTRLKGHTCWLCDLVQILNSLAWLFKGKINAYIQCYWKKKWESDTWNHPAPCLAQVIVQEIVYFLLLKVWEMKRKMRAYLWYLWEESPNGSTSLWLSSPTRQPDVYLLHSSTTNLGCGFADALYIFCVSEAKAEWDSRSTCVSLPHFPQLVS